MSQALGRAMFFVTLIQVGFCLRSADAGLIINLDFTNFSTGAPTDGSAILGGATLAQAQTVIETAANVWETAFAGSSSSISWSTNDGGTLTQNISVGWGPKSGATLATGGTNWFLSDGRWGSGSLTWDNDGSSEFFVDTSPTESSEWNQFSERDLTFNSIDVNVDRNYYDAPAGVTRDNSDMLTVAIHEIGHALGFLGSFPAYAAADDGSDGDIDITSGPLNGAEIGISGGHTNFTLSPPVDFPFAGATVPFYHPNVMGPSIVTGTRKLLTEADIAIVAQFLEFDMSTVNFDPQAIPEPSSWALMSLAIAASAGYRARKRRRQKAESSPQSAA